MSVRVLALTGLALLSSGFSLSSGKGAVLTLQLIMLSVVQGTTEGKSICLMFVFLIKAGLEVIFHS